MRKLAFLLVCCCAVPAQATLVLYEGFDYSPPGALVHGQTNGNGESWLRAGVANPPNGITVASGSLTAPTALQPTVGNSAKIAGVGNGSGSAIRLPFGSAITSGAVYFSFALRIDDLMGSNTTSGGFFTGLNNTGSSITTTNPTVVGAKISGRIDPNNATKYQLGVFSNVSPTGPATSWITPTLNVGDTHFIVAAYTFNAGTGDDVSSIWINPGSLGAGSAPTPTMTATGGTDLGQIGSVLLRQSPAPHLTLDELRVGTDWASVTVPEASSFLLVGCALMLARPKTVKSLVGRVVSWAQRS